MVRRGAAVLVWCAAERPGVVWRGGPSRWTRGRAGLREVGLTLMPEEARRRREVGLALMPADAFTFLNGTRHGRGPGKCRATEGGWADAHARRSLDLPKGLPADGGGGGWRGQEC